ncbi:MAG: site-specific integrase [Dysgonamonadaceae bacterium]|jgi:integrase|nr:site-specific integrase [Dysgonamonadaceae bacterium]
MLTYRFYLRLSRTPRDKQAGRLCIRLIYRRKVKNITRPFRIYPEEWDMANGCLVPVKTGDSRQKYLNEVEKGMVSDLQFLHTISEYFVENSCNFTLDDVAVMLADSSGGSISLQTYVSLLHRRSALQGDGRRLKAYSATAEAFRRFSAGRSPLLSELTSDRLNLLERAMKQHGLKLNTISFYFRNLRAIFNLATAEGIVKTPETSPFRQVFTGKEKTVKRALPVETIRLIRKFFDEHRNATAPAIRALVDAAALFLFCFYARGMSFVDAVSLKRNNLRDGAIYYYRRKTSRSIRVSISQPISLLMEYFEERYRTKDYLFPFIAGRAEFSYTGYESALKQQNRNLQRIAELIGCGCKITTHTARHTWATIAREQNVPVSVISEALGHHDEQTTLIYLASIDNSAIDEACDRVNRIVD